MPAKKEIGGPQREDSFLEFWSSLEQWWGPLPAPIFFFIAVLGQTPFSLPSLGPTPPLIPDQKSLSKARNKAARSVVLISSAF